VKITTLARLRGIYHVLTVEQRRQLTAIVQCQRQQINAQICESLVNLDLARVEGNTFIATEDGRYVASLL
jgi:hypothetical protein